MDHKPPNKNIVRTELEPVISELTLRQLFYIRKNLRTTPETNRNTSL